jgi:EpsI family protein
MKKYKFILVIILLIITAILSFAIPRAKYSGTGFISKLAIPSSISEWQGQDVTAQVGLNVNSDMYNFVSEALAYQYVNKKGEKVLFIILDAGNFHHPKVCFTGAGFKITELPDTEFHLSDRTFKTHTIFTRRGKDSYLNFYWIVINKNIAHEWIEQKFKQLYFSMFNRKKTGLMVRIDVPTKEADIKDAMILAKQFVNDLSQTLQLEQAGYIFGELNFK